jgi:hypothetical protein
MILVAVGIHVLLVHFRGPEAAMRGFIAAIERKDGEGLIAWLIPEEREQGIDAAKVREALQMTLYKDAESVRHTIVSYPKDNEYPHTWYKWTVAWTNAANGEPLRTLDPNKVCGSLVWVVPSNEGWRVSFTQFIRSYYSFNETGFLVRSGKIPIRSKPLNYTLRRMKDAGIGFLYPMPKDPYITRPYKDFPSIMVVWGAAFLFALGLCAEIGARRVNSSQSQRTRMIAAVPLFIFGVVFLPKPCLSAEGLSIHFGAGPPPGIVLGLPMDNLVYYHLGISSVLELTDDRVKRLNEVLKEKTGKKEWWLQRVVEDASLEKAIRGILDKKQNDLRDRLIKAMKEAETETKNVKDPPPPPGAITFDTGMPYRLVTAIALDKKLKAILSDQQWKILTNAGKGLAEKKIGQVAPRAPRKISK